MQSERDKSLSVPRSFREARLAEAQFPRMSGTGSPVSGNTPSRNSTPLWCYKGKCSQPTTKWLNRRGVELDKRRGPGDLSGASSELGCEVTSSSDFASLLKLTRLPAHFFTYPPRREAKHEKGPRRRGLSEPLANDRVSILGKEKGRGYLSRPRPFSREGSPTASGQTARPTGRACY